MLNSVTVYCSSSSKIPAVYLHAGRDLGRALANQHWTLVYGGNNVGLMGILADAAREAKGKVIGITPRVFIDEGLADNKCDEFIVADNMRHRKALMELRGDAFIALPGGLGTLEELFEIIVGRQLGYHNKPIVVLNINGFFNPLLQLIDNGVKEHFIRPKAREQFFVATTVDEAIAYLKDPSRQPKPSAYRDPNPTNSD
jgi:uncharacterized protein (TIGR00730 family)